MHTAVTVNAVDYSRQAAVLHAIRQAVFVDGQGIDPALERDLADATAVHVLAVAADGQCAGTGRLVLDADGQRGRIGRMAVLPEWRGQGIGAAMLHELEQQARARGVSRLDLHAQLPALPLYLRAGWLPCGPGFDEAGLAHLPLHKRLDGPMAVHGELAAQAALATLITHTGRQLRLLAPLLDPGLLDAPMVLDSLRALSARRQPVQVQILVDDPAAIVRCGGAVLALLQRRPSLFSIRQRSLDHTASANALAINDRGHWLLRPSAASPEGQAGLPWRPLAQRITQAFEQDWANAADCPELRPLRL